LDDDDELVDLGTDRPHSEAPEFPDVVELAMTPGPLGAVLFATPLSFLVGPFTKGLGGHTQVTHVADALDILDALDAHPTLSMVVLDCRAHDLDVATIAALLAERDPTPLLVLWGATAAMVDEIALASDDLRCLAIDESAAVAELAERCLAAG
jgi:CheY-like chemotaxis protein